MRYLLLAATAAALAGCGAGTNDQSAADTATTPPAATEAPPLPTSAAPESPEEINQQDQISREQAKREAHAMDRRPLLDHLPMSVGDVTISVYGLADDNETTILAIDPGARTDEQALDVYRDALSAHGDEGTAYEPKVIR